MTNDDDDHTRNGSSVGYGKPPIHSRFKPGQSGNKKGRPKSKPVLVNDEQAMHDMLFQQVRLKSGGKHIMMAPYEVVLHQLTKAAMNGDVSASKLLLGLVTKLNSRKPRLPKLEEMSDSELNTFLHFIRATKAKLQKPGKNG
jgi:hypothetical protein